MKYSMRLLAAIALLFASATSPLLAADQPNVIVILADDMGYADLTCFGAVDMSTPNLDRCQAKECGSPTSTRPPPRARRRGPRS